MKWLLAWWNKPPTRRSNPQRRSRRLGLERLSERILPAQTFTWVAPADGTWSTATNWKDGTGANGVPGAADQAIFDSTSTKKCTLTAGAACSALEVNTGYTGTIDLGSFALTVSATGGMGMGIAGGLYGGTITNGNLEILQGTMTQDGTTLGTVNLTIGGSVAGAAYSLMAGNINAAAGTALALNVTGGATFTVYSDSTIGNDIYIDGGTVLFCDCVPTGVTIANGAIFDVMNSSSTLDLECPKVFRTDSDTYISNAGLVEKTDPSFTTELYFGIQNIDTSAVLSVGNGTLQIDNGSPGHFTASVYQSAGATRIYNGATLDIWKSYTQDGGTLSAMGVAMGTSVSTLATGLNQSVYINGGSVFLGDGTSNHRTTLNATNANFQFGASATLNFGINPGATDNDQVNVSLMSITAGAKAVLDTSNLGGGVVVPSQMWVFVTATGKSPDSIAGAFPANVGTTAYTMATDPATRTEYELST